MALINYAIAEPSHGIVIIAIDIVHSIIVCCRIRAPIDLQQQQKRTVTN